MELQARKELLDRLSKRLRRRKFSAILFAFFLLGVNAFAWFVFNTQVGVEVQGNVASWDIRLRDEDNELVDEAVVEVVDMKPGMETFSKSYLLNNQGEVDASFSYSVEHISILGRNINLTNVNDKLGYCENYYPFSITFSKDMDVIPSLESARFSVIVNWNYEDNTKYYRLNEVYDYNDEFSYYKFISNQYTNFAATASNYLDNRNDLYLEKDDADTYFGMKCHEYEESSGHSCLEIGLLLKVSQVNQ